MKKRIRVLLFALAGCLTLNSCTAIDALQRAWEFQQNFYENNGMFGNKDDDSSLEEPSTEAQEVTAEMKEEREAFDAYLDELFVEWLEYDSFGIHFTLQHPDAYGITVEDYVLGNYEELDDEQLEEEWEDYEESYIQLKLFDEKLLTTQQKILREKLLYDFELTEKYAETPDYSSYIGGANGIVFTMADTFFEYAFLEKKDVEAYLLYLEDLPNYIDYAIDMTKLQITDDFVPSKYMLKTNINNINTICSGENNIFLDGFNQKIEEASFLTSQEKSAYKKANQQKVKNYVNPAFETLKEQLQDWYDSEEEYKGLWAMEGGREYYEYLVEYYTGSSMSVNEVYRYLMNKLKTYENALSTVLSQSKQTYNKITEQDYGFTLTDPVEILESLREYTKQSFPAIEDPGYTIGWLPEALESDGLLAYYLIPQIDTNVKNIIRLNKENLDTDAAQLYTTLAHEGYPGHLYASNYINQQGWHPINGMLDYPWYSEGWAEYVGLRSLHYWDLPGKVEEALIYNEELGYILQAITDIGINYKGWSLEDMTNVWKNYYDIEDQEELKEIYDYFASEPATILSYPMGYLQVMDLRNTTKIILGDNFSDKKFAELFLNIGGAPFDIAEDCIFEWANEIFLKEKAD